MKKRRESLGTMGLVYWREIGANECTGSTFYREVKPELGELRLTERASRWNEVGIRSGRNAVSRKEENVCGVQINVKTLAMQGHNPSESGKMSVTERTLEGVLRDAHG